MEVRLRAWGRGAMQEEKRRRRRQQRGREGDRGRSNSSILA
jgi:hypothetical protein